MADLSSNHRKKGAAQRTRLRMADPTPSRDLGGVDGTGVLAAGAVEWAVVMVSAGGLGTAGQALVADGVARQEGAVAPEGLGHQRAQGEEGNVTRRFGSH